MYYTPTGEGGSGRKSVSMMIIGKLGNDLLTLAAVQVVLFNS